MTKKENYRIWRMNGCTSAEAWSRSEQRPRYPKVGAWNPAHVSHRETVRWVEHAELAGLRLVGFADEIAKHIEHRGWFTSEFQDEVMRGIVYQLPARNGTEQFLYGYADPNNPGCALLSMCIINDKYDAARFADRFAELHAEDERAYNADWHQVQHAIDNASDARAEAREALQLVRDLETCDAPSIRKAIKADWCRAWAAYRRAMSDLVAALDNPSKITLADF
jgi:hypothetical protein